MGNPHAVISGIEKDQALDQDEHRKMIISGGDGLHSNQVFKDDPEWLEEDISDPQPGNRKRQSSPACREVP